jgi:hypothetical protein
MADDPEKQAQFVAAATSFRAFLNHWWFIDPDTGSKLNLGQVLWPGQERFVTEVERTLLIYVLKARKLGYTTLECAFDAWCARFRDPAGRVHLFSRREKAAIDLLDRVRYGLRHLPEWMQLPTGVDNQTQLQLLAGPDDVRTLEAYPADETTAVEQSATHVHLDEWWLMRNPESVLQSVQPTILRSAHIITTSRGSSGFPADLWRRSEAGDTEFVAFFSGTRESKPQYTDAFLRAKAKTMSTRSFKQEYPETAADALWAGGEYPFKAEDLSIAGEDTPGRSAPQDGHVYVKAWDTGGSGEDADASVGIVLDVTDPVHDVVEYIRLKGVSYPTLQGRIEHLHRRYPGPTVIEANAAGTAVAENTSIPDDEMILFTTTRKSKPVIIEGLVVAFESQTLRYSHEDFEQLHRELSDYQYADEELVQDSVMALAIAEHHASEAFKRRAKKGRAMRPIRV